MKTRKIILVASISYALTFCENINAQIPNAGFETWESFAEFSKPKEWGVTTFFGDTDVPESDVKKSTNAKSGSFAVRLESRKNGLPSELLSGGDPTVIDGGEGFSFTGRPKKMNCYYQFTYTGDTANISVMLYKWNGSWDNAVIIGLGEIDLSANKNTYALADIPIEYISGEIPNLALIDVKVGSSIETVDGDGNITGIGSSKGGSILLVDDFSFDMVNGINDNLQDENKLTVYPNPSKDIINIKYNSNESEHVSISIKDINGRMVYCEKGIHNTNEHQESIDVSGFAKGIYLLQISDESEIVSRKIVIQ